MNGLDPFIHLAEVLERIVSGAVKANALDRRLPWVWAADRDAAARTPEAQAA